MKRVQGIGGIFIRARDPQKLQAWYDKQLGISPRADSPWGADDEASLLEWRDKDDPQRNCFTVFSMFPMDSDFFQPGDQDFLLNFRVDDLDALLTELEQEGIVPLGEIRVYKFGRFARIVDPEGKVVELWEPTQGF